MIFRTIPIAEFLAKTTQLKNNNVRKMQAADKMQKLSGSGRAKQNVTPSNLSKYGRILSQRVLCGLDLRYCHHPDGVVITIRETVP